jgi:hypothetical protein
LLLVKHLLFLLLAMALSPVWAQSPPATPPATAPGDATDAPLAEEAALREENARLRLELDRLRNEAVNAPLIDRENQQLRERILSLETERERLMHENQTLGSWRDGLKTGAGIFVIGLVIGLLLGRARRRSGWSEV